MPESLAALPHLSSIIGQSELKRRIADRLTVVRSKGWPFPHTLICGDDGMGRFAVAKAVAAEVSGPDGIKAVSAVNSFLDLSGHLSNIHANSCLLLKDIGTIERSIVKRLASASRVISLSRLEPGLAPARSPYRSHRSP